MRGDQNSPAQEIKKRYEMEAKMLPEMREKFLAQVKRWEYSSEPIWSYGERLRKENTDADILPGPENAFHVCGYDERDRPIYQKSFGSALLDTGRGREKQRPKLVPESEPWLEEFFVHGTDILEVSRFVGGELEELDRMIFRNKLLVEEFAISRGVFGHTRIQYQGTKRQLHQSLSESGHVTFEIAFGPHGEQSYFRVRRDGTRYALGQPLPKGITVESLKETIRNRLLVVIPQIVSAAVIKEPIYCVALAYDSDDALPPILGIGLESERRKWREEYGKAASDFIWNPAEFKHYEKSHTQIDDEALDEACDYWNGKLAESSSFGPAIKLLVDVAGELNNISWPNSVLRTSDFVVYAVDFDLANLRKNLKAAVGVEKFAALKASNLL